MSVSAQRLVGKVGDMRFKMRTWQMDVRNNPKGGREGFEGGRERVWVKWGTRCCRVEQESTGY